MNILTFDIEDWFHTHKNRQQFSGHQWSRLPAKVEANTERILDLLDELNLKATFFVLGWVAKYHPNLIKQIHSRGHDIAAHSHWHHNPHLISPVDFEKDLKLCLSTIEDVIGEKVTMYRAPGFNLNLKDMWAFAILAQYGIKVDSSVELYPFQKKEPFVINWGENKIMEFPLILSPFGYPYTGGGYFRVIPLNMLQLLFKKQQYHLLYFHPRDFDNKNPESNMFSFFRNRLNSFNTDICLDKVKVILSQYKTQSIGEAIKNLED